MLKIIRPYKTLFLILLLTSCSDPVPPGRIMFKNDSMDESYNKMSVSSSSLDETLSPGQYLIFPKGTTSFSVSREYKDYTRRYSVECPEIEGDGISIKMIDIHVNRIAGGCKTVSASKD